MKKLLKIILIIIGILVGIIALDTGQALIFQNSPILKIRVQYNGGDIYYIDRGILLDFYQYGNGDKKIIFKWQEAPNIYLTENSFEFNIDVPKTEMKVGEEVCFSAKLTNLAERDFILEHGTPLIVLYIRSANDSSEEGVGSTLVQTTLNAQQSIEKKVDFKAEKAGDYLLRAYCSFNIDGKEYRYDYGDVSIKITDN